MRASVIILSAALASHAAAADPSPAPDWIAGHWLSCENGRQTSESWIKGRSGIIAGVNVSDNGFEFLRIAEADGAITYLASPGGRPPTAFTLVENTGARAVFENKTHDFPQRIIYAREGDMLTAAIEGEINGEQRGMQWRFRAAEIGAGCDAAQ